MCSRGSNYGIVFGPAFYSIYGGYFGDDASDFTVASNFIKLYPGPAAHVVALSATVFELGGYTGTYQHVDYTCIAIYFRFYVGDAVGGIAA